MRVSQRTSVTADECDGNGNGGGGFLSAFRPPVAAETNSAAARARKLTGSLSNFDHHLHKIGKQPYCWRERQPAEKSRTVETAPAPPPASATPAGMGVGGDSSSAGSTGSAASWYHRSSSLQ